MSTGAGSSRAWLLALWIAALALLALFVRQQLVIGTDLRLFLPSPHTPQEHLLLEEIGEGPGSRVLVIAIGGGPPEQLADTSRALASALAEHPLFRFVANGELSLRELPESLLPYRYLVSTTLDEHAFDAEYLRGEIRSRARDLASPAGAFLEPWLPRDPTLELLAMLRRWQPAQEPNRLYDVWFDRAGEQALLLAETKAAAFDPDRQRAAIESLQRAFESIDSARALSLTISGAGQFSVLMEERTRSEAQLLGAAASVGMALLLLAAYRRASAIAFSALPLASAGLAGTASVTALFGTVHGITLAFGFTLIGVAQDYPVHLLSHRRAARAPLEIVRRLWPTLATGVASTCIAYLSFFFSGVVGLKQLACFTIAGLAAASLTTRYLLPRVMTAHARDYGESQWLERVRMRIDALPRSRWLPIVLVLASIACIALSRTPMWENDLSRLTPVPTELIARDQRLRGALGTADVRYLLVLEAHDAQQALRRLESLQASLDELVRHDAIVRFDHAARYIPSIDTQLRRQAKLPDAATLRRALAAAQAGTPFKANAFEPFLREVQQAKVLPPLTPEDLRASALGANLDMLLTSRDAGTRALITLNGVKDPQALQALADTSDHLLLLDLKAASETLVARQRTHLLWSLAVASLLLVAVVAFALRSRLRVYRVLAPMALTSCLVVAILQLSGVSLNLFHLIALMLAAGLGLDYALFFEHAADDPFEQRRTLHAVLVCSLSTLLVFALLATSKLPVLQAIGVTVSLGVVLNFALAVGMAGNGFGSGPPATGQSGIEGTRIPGQKATADGALCGAFSGQPAEISSLLPHAGAMCLLERIVEWDDESIRLQTSTHRSADNPLRSDGRLRAVHLCEYGAQAMAVHGALKSQANGEKAAPGMLVSLRSVSFSRDYIEEVEGLLLVEARCLQASATSLQYSFRVTCADELLAEGRAAVVLQARSG